MQTFRAPIKSISLSEKNEVPKSVQLFRTGTFFHSEYGQFNITPEILKDIQKNFQEQVRGIDLAIDYKHENEDIAAGWIKDVKLSEDGSELWADVDWTPKGKTVLSEKEFRYLSPEFTFQYEDNETLKKFGPTLLGAGLTNRPTIKKMAPVVELSEYKYAEGEREKLQKEQESRANEYGIEVTEDSSLTPGSGEPNDLRLFADPVNYKFPMGDQNQTGNARVRFKQFANQIYKQDSSKAVVHNRIVERELALGIKPSFDPKDPLDALLSGDLKSKLQKEETKKMNEKDVKCADPMQMSPEEMAKLPQDQLLAMLQALIAQHKGMMNQKGEVEVELGEMKKEKMLSEKKAVFAKMLSEGKACKAQEQAYLDGDMVKFAELAQPIKLSEVGNQTIVTETAPKIETKSDAEKEVSRLASIALSEKKFKSMGEAISGILKDKQELRSKIYG